MTGQVLRNGGRDVQEEPPVDERVRYIPDDFELLFAKAEVVITAHIGVNDNTPDKTIYGAHVKVSGDDFMNYEIERTDLGYRFQTRGYLPQHLINDDLILQLKIALGTDDVTIRSQGFDIEIDPNYR